jgi:phage tail protein X
MAAEARYLQLKLAELKKGLESAVQACLHKMKESLSQNIYDKFDQAITAAVNEANATAAKWGAPVNRENRAAGGLPWSTYKLVQEFFDFKNFY